MHRPKPRCGLGNRGWIVTRSGRAIGTDGIMRTVDGRVALPLSEVLLP
jgi:hypothetical protein